MTSTPRRLIAVDAQTLLGCRPGKASKARWEFAIAGSLGAVSFREATDHLIIAVTPDWAFTVKALAPFARLLVRAGRHGADLALCTALEDADFIASRYHEAVIASGSHILREPLRALADAGVDTTVACLPNQTSRQLTAVAGHVIWLDRPRGVLSDTVATSRRTPALASVDADPRTVPPRTRLGLAA